MKTCLRDAGFILVGASIGTNLFGAVICLMGAFLFFAVAAIGPDDE
jgi:hypothetical protein